MKNVVCKMLKIYVPYSNLDWMNYRLVREDVTYHHIKKKSEGGKKEIGNALRTSILAFNRVYRYRNLFQLKRGI